MLDCELHDNDIEEAANRWNNSLVGFFVGKRPPYLAVKASLSKALKTRDAVELKTLEY